MGNSNHRYVFIDILRIIASFLVIVNHTNSDLFLSLSPSNPIWYISVTWFFVCKMAVPIFVMLSGYTMLDKVDTYEKSGKRILRAILVLVLFSIVPYIREVAYGLHQEAGIKDFIKTVIREPLSYAYWYMYLYIGILVMMPFLQRFVKGMEKKDVQVFCVISGLVYGIWPIVTHFKPALQYSEYMNFSIFDGYICMLMLGYYLKKYVTISEQKKKWAWAGLILPVLFNVCMTRREYDIQTEGYLFFDNRVFVTILIQSVSCFYLFMISKIGNRENRWLSLIGGCTFAIYLVADIVIEKCLPIYTNMVSTGMNSFVAMLLYEMIVFFISLAIALVLKRIPGLRKLL